MTINLSSSPSPSARYVGNSSCLACHKEKQHWQQTAHKLGWTIPGAPGKMQDFSRHQDYFNALESFPEVADYTRGTRLELGDSDSARGDDKFKLRAFSDARLPISVRSVAGWPSSGSCWMNALNGCTADQIASLTRPSIEGRSSSASRPTVSCGA